MLRFPKKSLRMTLLRYFIFIFHLLTSQLSSGAELNINSLDRYLSDQEAQYEDIVAGTESYVKWFDGAQKTDISIIYLHGFSASRQEISPVTERLSQQLGANIYYARLTGHGRSDDAMAEASVQKWLADTKQAYKIGRVIGDQVIIVSTSTGGTLATWLISQFSDGVLANIMVSPNFGIRSKLAGILRWSWGLTLAKWIEGDYRSFEPISEKHGLYWTERYPTESLVPVVKLVEEINQLDKSLVRIPQMVIYSPKDKVIDPDKVVETMAEFSESEVSMVEFSQSTDPYQHVLAGDACSPESNNEMVKIIADYIESVR